MPGPISSSALSPDQLDALAAELTQAATRLRQKNNSNGTKKENLGTASIVANAGIAALRSLMTPKDRFLDLMLIPAAMGVLRVFLHWGALERIPRDCVTPISYAKLAEQLGAEVGLLSEYIYWTGDVSGLEVDLRIAGRLAWTLVAAGFLKQVGTDQVVNTPNSVVLIDNPTLKGVLDVVSQ